MKIKTAEFEGSAPDLRSCPVNTRPELAFIGRSNVGKSSLINSLVERRDLARVSVTPGKTQLINFFTINGAWSLVDLPGYGYARVSKEKRADFNEAVAAYLADRENLLHTFVLIDSRLPPQEIDKVFIQWLVGNGGMFSIVFTKADKQSMGKTKSLIARFRQSVLVGITPAPEVLVSSATEGTGRKELLAHIAGILAG